MLEPNPHQGRSVMDVLMNDERYSELVIALVFSDLANELRDVSADAVTMFAPTNAAFNKMPQAFLTRLFQEDDKTMIRCT